VGPLGGVVDHREPTVGLTVLRGNVGIMNKDKRWNLAEGPRWRILNIIKYIYNKIYII